MLLLKGCGIFETRDPETPQTIRSTYFPPTTAQLVIDNLAYSILEKNSENYFKCISAGEFKFIPDSRSLQQYEQIFLSWNRASEKNYLDNLISQTNPTSSSVLFLDNTRMTQFTSDSAALQADYIFVFQHRLSVPKSATGNLTITIATDEDALFYIRKWEDFRQNDSDFTWSEFKANFAN